jgi:hypothetical protein
MTICRGSEEALRAHMITEVWLEGVSNLEACLLVTTSSTQLDLVKTKLLTDSMLERFWPDLRHPIELEHPHTPTSCV